MASDSACKLTVVIHPLAEDRYLYFLSTKEEVDRAVVAAQMPFWQWRTNPPIYEKPEKLPALKLLEENRSIWPGSSFRNMAKPSVMQGVKCAGPLRQ